MNLRKCLIKPCDLETGKWPSGMAGYLWGGSSTLREWLARCLRGTSSRASFGRNKTKDRSTVSSLRQNLWLPVLSAESPAYTSTPAQHNSIMDSYILAPSDSIVVQRRRRPRRTSAAAAAVVGKAYRGSEATSWVFRQQTGSLSMPTAAADGIAQDGGGQF